MASCVVLLFCLATLSALQAEQDADQRGVDLIAQALLLSDSSDLQRDLLLGMQEGLQGRRRVKMPSAWRQVATRLLKSNDAEVRRLVLELSLQFDDPQAKAVLRRLATASTAPVSDRRRAIELLAQQRDPDFDQTMLKLASDADVRVAALRGLAEFSHPRTPAVLLSQLPAYDQESQQVAIATLASRPQWAEVMLDAIDADRMDRRLLTAFTIRQLHSLGKPRLVERVQQMWGSVRATDAGRKKQMQNLQRRLSGDVLAQADLKRGQQLYRKQCGTCHQLFGEGERVGPDLTGAQRTNLNYLLENLVDPNAAVSKDYHTHVLVTADGRVLTGLIVAEDSTTLTLQSTTDRKVIPLEEIVERRRLESSIMPEKLLESLSLTEVRDLIGYLMSPSPSTLRK